MATKSQLDQVFINFHGEELRNGFISHLVSAFKRNSINVVIGNKVTGESLEALSKRMEESRIVLVILTTNYTESSWCLNELTKIMDCVEKDKLIAFPIYYKMNKTTVKHMSGQFGDTFRDLAKHFDATKSKEWENALMLITSKMGYWVFDERDIINKNLCISEDNIINNIVEDVNKVFMGFRDSRVDMFHRHMLDRYYSKILTLSDSPTSSLQDRGEGLRYGFGSHLVKALESYKNRSQLGMKIAGLLLLFFVLQQIALSIGLIYQGGAMDEIVENVQKLQKYIPTKETKNPIDKYTEFPIGEVGEEPESYTSDATTNDEFLDRTATFPRDSKVKPPQIQVFINFRGEQLRYNFVGYLVDALRRSEINVFIDNQALRGEDLNSLFKRIEDSGIAIVVFSSRYTESTWCLEELVKIKERVHQGLLKVLPIFYKVSPTNVKRLKGDFGDHFRDKEYTYEYDEPMIKRWKEAIAFVSHKFALTLDEKSIVWEIDFVETIVKEVLKMLQAISTVESGQSSR